MGTENPTVDGILLLTTRLGTEQSLFRKDSGKRGWGRLGLPPPLVTGPPLISPHGRPEAPIPAARPQPLNLAGTSMCPHNPLWDGRPLSPLPGKVFQDPTLITASWRWLQCPPSGQPERHVHLPGSLSLPRRNRRKDDGQTGPH